MTKWIDGSLLKTVLESLKTRQELAAFDDKELQKQIVQNYVAFVNATFVEYAETIPGFEK